MCRDMECDKIDTQHRAGMIDCSSKVSMNRSQYEFHDCVSVESAALSATTNCVSKMLQEQVSAVPIDAMSIERLPAD